MAGPFPKTLGAADERVSPDPSGQSDGDAGNGRELEAIQAIARTRKTDVVTLCEELQRIAAKATASERAAIYLVDLEKRECAMAAVPFGYDGPLVERHWRTSLDAPFLGEAIRTLRPQVFSAVDLPEPYRVPSIEAGFVEYAVLPLHSEGVLMGTLNLARTRAEPYALQTVQLALALVDMMAIQIERARLNAREKERATNLARLSEDLRHRHADLTRTNEDMSGREPLANLGMLAALVAHEIRNPLGVIFNVVAQLRKVLPPEHSQSSQLIAILHEESMRMDKIVRAFLDFGRPAAPIPTLIDVERLVASAIELTTRALMGSTVQWRTEFAPAARWLEGDEHVLRQALMNLLANAVEAQSLRGAVWVKTACCQVEGRDQVAISIEDEGVPLTGTCAKRAFEPFFTTKASGTGLGLAIVRRAAEMHRGTVTMQAGDARGTIVTLTLPVRWFETDEDGPASHR